MEECYNEVCKHHSIVYVGNCGELLGKDLCEKFKSLKAQTKPVAEVPCSGGLVAMQSEAKMFIDANVWDGEDRSGATNDRATFNPDELQDLINDMLEHMSN